MDLSFSFSLLATFIVAGLVLVFWRDALRQRDAANAAAIEACERLGLQFLDGTASFARWRLQREAGRRLLRRVFVFDYTAHSIERRQGFVIMLAGRVESVGFATTEDAKPKATAAMPVVNANPTVNVTMTFGPTTPSVESAPPAKVFDLDEWRRTHPERGRLH